MKGYDPELVKIQDFVTIQAQGEEVRKKNPKQYQQLVSMGNGEDVSIILYTSGTTGQPKGVVLTYDNTLLTGYYGGLLEGLTENEEILAYLPVAWIGDHIFSYAQSYAMGFCVNCAESSETIAADMREIGPTYYFAPPRVFESLLTNVQIRMEDAAPFKRKMFKYFMQVAKTTGIKLLEKKSVSLFDRFKYALGLSLIHI